MEASYPVSMGNKPVGKVLLRKQGLYYSIRCRCQLSGGVVCRLAVRCDGRQEKLGILVPMEEGFGLDTKLPAKRLGQGSLEFLLLPRHETVNGTFVPIYPEEPFAYISRLKDGFLARKDGQLGMLIQ